MSVSVQKLQCGIKHHFAVPVADWQRGRTDVRPHCCEHLCAGEHVNCDFPLTPLAACPDEEFDQNVQALYSVKLLLSGWTLLFSHRSHKSQTDSDATLISNSAVWGLGAWLFSVFHAFFPHQNEQNELKSREFSSPRNAGGEVTLDGCSSSVQLLWCRHQCQSRDGFISCEKSRHGYKNTTHSQKRAPVLSMTCWCDVNDSMWLTLCFTCWIKTKGCASNSAMLLCCSRLSCCLKDQFMTQLHLWALHKDSPHQRSFILHPRSSINIRVDCLFNIVQWEFVYSHFLRKGMTQTETPSLLLQAKWATFTNIVENQTALIILKAKNKRSRINIQTFTIRVIM